MSVGSKAGPQACIDIVFAPLKDDTWKALNVSIPVALAYWGHEGDTPNGIWMPVAPGYVWPMIRPWKPACNLRENTRISIGDICNVPWELFRDVPIVKPAWLLGQPELELSVLLDGIQTCEGPSAVCSHFVPSLVRQFRLHLLISLLGQVCCLSRMYFGVGPALDLPQLQDLAHYYHRLILSHQNLQRLSSEHSSVF